VAARIKFEYLHRLGNPVLGDKIYAPNSRIFRQMLHAEAKFSHPRTGEWMNFGRRYLTISGKLSRLHAYKLIDCKIFRDRFRSLSRLHQSRRRVEKGPTQDQCPVSD
jgi:hypothetical protein